MIISASRRTDIPAHYGRWFIERLRCGYVDVPNPFNRKQVRKVDLAPEKVDAFVFWTKDPAPFIKYLDRIDDMGYHYYFQYTLNNYPSLFEPRIPPFEERVELFKALSRRIGKERVVLRYDPIIISDITGVRFHEKNLKMIRRELSEQTDTIVISFMDIYGKLSQRLKRIEEKRGIHIEDVHEPEGLNLVKRTAVMISEVFQGSSITVTTCSEPFDLSDLDISRGSCIDVDRINRVFDMDLEFKKDIGQRQFCLCSESVDIGQYNSCPSMCTYCYAVGNERTVRRNYQRIMVSPR